MLEIERLDGVPVARATQDIDAASSAALKDELAECIGPDTACLVLDLSHTRYVDSAGLDMLFRLNDRLQQSRSMLLLVIAGSSPLNRLAAIASLPRFVSVHATLDAALRSAEHERSERTAGQPAAFRPGPR
jgi:anti-sigma B factor antagonist